MLTQEQVRLIDLSEVKKRTLRGKTRIYTDIGLGQFPAPIKDGSRSRWIEQEVDEWISRKIAERDGAAV